MAKHSSFFAYNVIGDEKSFITSTTGYTNDEITIINKFSRYLNDEDKDIVDTLYKIDVLIYSVNIFKRLSLTLSREY